MSNNFSIAEALVEATQMLRRAGIAEARREAASLLALTTGRDRTFLITEADALLTVDDLARYRALLERRAAGEPFQYIAGHQEFFKLDFTVTPDVLIPRPDTELLVLTALALIGADEKSAICDVGTGSGCIAVSLLHERPKLRGVALDISPRALSVAAGNAARHGVRSRLEFVASDLFAALDPARRAFALIASNPPYVLESEFPHLQREVRDYEPRIALTPGGDGLSVVRRLLADAPAYLLPGGHLLMEIGYNQMEAVVNLIDADVWTLLDIHQDIQGIPRTVALRRL